MEGEKKLTFNKRVCVGHNSDLPLTELSLVSVFCHYQTSNRRLERVTQ